ncbi:MAG: GntR family transcriptional regulator [Rhodobacteraceae bacterium]|nr:GntR family transcriptional regulator [Paracoccaceae bacterium]
MPRISHRQRIHDLIRSRILRGEIGPDDKLVDTALAEELGVSRMPVREAMMQLVSEGYLEGTSRGFALARLGPERVLEVFLLRRLLEPRAAAGAAQTMGAAAISDLRDVFETSARTLQSGDFEVFYRASEQFRNIWLMAVPNSELRATIQRYSVQVQSVRLATMRDPDAHRTIVAGQRDLMSSFAERDALAAADRILRFVIEAEASYLRILRTRGHDSASCYPDMA